MFKKLVAMVFPVDTLLNMFKKLVAMVFPVHTLLNLFMICVEHVEKACCNGVFSRYSVEFVYDLC